MNIFVSEYHNYPRSIGKKSKRILSWDGKNLVFLMIWYIRKFPVATYQERGGYQNGLSKVT